MSFSQGRDDREGGMYRQIFICSHALRIVLIGRRVNIELWRLVYRKEYENFMDTLYRPLSGKRKPATRVLQVNYKDLTSCSV